MKKALWMLPIVAAGVAAARKAGTAHRSEDRTADRWLTVTVNRSMSDVRPAGKLPGSLRRFADEIDVRVSPAPGDRGTEVAARFREPVSAASSSAPARLAGRDPRQELRLALRETKALLEAGEVLRPDAPPTTRPTPGGKLVELFTRRSGGEGVL
ncbi:hypothetical protein [Streptomyces sp. JHA26]|uniref:hypothetical protein n=1 Tax=Streptomyces sp. JHA26 TaxID=1917143 RepID=UPI00098AD045|nr:hypothetical protein [Streptomyces sp. JHA26]